jgi:tetratricopeptide (TPR) repeat protein
VSDPERQVADARALAERGAIAEALAAYDAVVARYSADPDPDVADAVAQALDEKAGLLVDDERAEEALDALAAALEHDARRGPEPAEADDETVAWRAGDRRLRVLRVHALRGWTLTNLGRLEEALAAYDAALAHDDGSGDEDVLGHVRIVADQRARCLNALERWEEAVDAADAGLARLAATDAEADVVFRVAALMYNKAWALRMLGRHAELLDVLAGIEARFGAACEEPGADPDLSRQVLNALDLRAATLIDLARDEEVIAVCDVIVLRFAAAADAGTRAQVAEACRRRARALEVLARFDEAIAAYRDTLLRFGADEDPGVRPTVVAAMGSLAGRLIERGDTDEALVMLDAYVDGGGDAVWALTHKGTQLHRQERHDEAVTAYDALLAVLEGDEEHVRAQRLVTLMNRVEVLVAADRLDEASETEDRLVALAGDDAALLFGILDAELGERDDPHARVMRAGLALKEASVHAALGREDEARAVLEALVERAGDDELPDVRRIVGLARDELEGP